MVLMSMLSIFCVVGTKSTTRNIVPPLGGTSPTLVLARSAAQEKSGGLLSVTHISLAGFGERKLVNWTWPSNMATAFPEESILVTTRRTSGGCWAATEPASISATPGTSHDRLLVIGLLPKKSAPAPALRRLRAGARPVEHRHGGCDDARHVGKVGRNDHGVVGLGEVAERADVELGHLEVRGLQPALLADRLGDDVHRGRGRIRHDAQRRRLALRLVDRRLLLAFGSEDRRLLLAFGEVDLLLLLALGLRDQRALLALGGDLRL